MKKNNLTWDKLLNNVIDNKDSLDLKIDLIFAFFEKYKSNNGKKKLRLFSEDLLFWRDINNLYSEIPEDNIGKKLIFTNNNSFVLFENWKNISDDMRQNSWMFSEDEIRIHQKSKPSIDKKNQYFYLYDFIESYNTDNTYLEYCSIMFLFSANINRLNKLFKKNDLRKLVAVIPPSTHIKEPILYEKKYKRNYDSNGNYLSIENRFCHSILDATDFSYLEDHFLSNINNFLPSETIVALDKKNNPVDLSIISKISNAMDWKVYESTWNKLLNNKELSATKIKNEIATKIDFGDYIIEAFNLCSLTSKTSKSSVYFLQKFPPSIWSSVFNRGSVFNLQSKEFSFYLTEMNYFLQRETSCFFGGSCSEYKVSAKVFGGVELIYEAEDLIMLSQIFTHKSFNYDLKRIMFSLRQLQKASFEQESILRHIINTRE